VSVGDIALIVGSMAVLLSRRVLQVEPIRSPTWIVVFAMPGGLIIISTLISTVANQTSSLFDMAALVTQYGLTFLVLPVVLAQERIAQIAAAARAFVYGLGTMIVVGLVIITFLPGLELVLASRGWLFSVGSDRTGLFAGVGELSKMAGMSIPIVYYLAVRGWLSVARAGLLSGVMLVALIVTRSGSGAGAAAAALLVVVLLHLSARSNIRAQTVQGGGGRGPLVGAVGIVLGALVLRQLDSRGVDYREAFVERITAPLAAQGVDGVGSARIRERLIGEAWRVIGDHTVFGIGPGLYHQQASYGQGVHVVPLMLWAETGLLAMFGWLILIVGLGLAILSRLRRAPIAAVAAGGVLTAFIATHMTAPYMYGRGLFFPMMVAFFLLADSARPANHALPNDMDAIRQLPSRRSLTTSFRR
jgi:hypothetical protein